MIDSLRDLFESPALKRRLIGMAVFMVFFHVAILIPLLSYTPSHPTLMGLALLAYGLGLRHAVDPDHIAAIDNTTRKLMQEGKKPVGVGFFFALGHSTIVVVMCVLVALSSSFVNEALPSFKETGALIGASVSCAFLLALAFINLIVLLDAVKAWRSMQAGNSTAAAGASNADYLDGGLLSRILRPVLKTVGNSWSMYVVGLLFGLGFDTASEVALLGISASTDVSGMPVAVLLLIPLSFTAGMSLIDTLDGVLMLGAYGWAFLQPARKLYYNITITFTSVVIALFIGSIEALQIIGRHSGSTGALWAFAAGIHLENWGFYIIGIFALSWIASMLLYRWRGYDRIVSPPHNTRTPL